MKQQRHRWTPPPLASRRRHSPLDNVALVPASELASLAKWQRQAQALPAGEILLVLPQDNSRLQAVGVQIRRSLKARGRHTTITTIRLC